MKLLFTHFTVSALLLVCLAGCAVYVPTVPSTPLVKKGQVEVSAGLRGLTSFEAGAAWAPANHLLLNVESGFQSSTSTTTTNNIETTYHDFHRQVCLGVGYYRAPTEQPRWYLAAVGGLGVASTTLHAVDVGILSPWLPLPVPYISGYYEAKYLREYLQGYAAYSLGPIVTGGLSVRGTLVNYTRFTYESQDVSPTNRGFIEPTLFLRLGHGVVQGQGTLGLSLPTGGNTASPYNRRTAPVSSLISLTVVFRPDLLRHK